MIVDSHCHLDFPHLNNQLDDIISRAKNNGVDYLLSICTTLESFERIKIIVRKYNNVYGSLGIHPHETEKFREINSSLLTKLLKSNKKIVAIGETGLDYYYNHSDKKIQKKIFHEHIVTASQLNLPIIVHTRNAEKDTFDILRSEQKNSNLKILIHCFLIEFEYKIFHFVYLRIVQLTIYYY